jgi:hypothetical protein
VGDSKTLLEDDPEEGSDLTVAFLKDGSRGVCRELRSQSRNVFQESDHSLFQGAGIKFSSDGVQYVDGILQVEIVDHMPSVSLR